MGRENTEIDDLKKTEKLLNSEILSFIRDGLRDTGGEDERGFGSHYQKHYSDYDRGFAPYIFVIASFLHKYRLDFDRVTEIGAGIGQHAILLAARGWNVTAIESWTVRYQHMCRLFERIGEVAPTVRARLDPRREWYPDNINQYFDGRTIGFFDSLGIVDEETGQRMTENLVHVGGVIVDMRVFFVARRTRAEQDRLSDAIERIGFAPPEVVWDWPGDSFAPHRFMFFKRLRA